MRDSSGGNTAKASAVELRSAEASDLRPVLALLERANLPTVGVAEALSGFVVAESEGEIVGVVGLEACGDRYALLRSAAVGESWRGRGLGRRLIECVISNAEEKDVRTLYLLTTTAEGYFANFGFERVAREEVPAEVRATEEFMSACPASAAVMKLELAAEPNA